MVIDTFGELEGTSARVLQPGDDGYDEARISFNGMIDRRPAVIVQCRTTSDVVAAVRVARAARLPIAIRGGGHSVAGHCMADDALVVDLRHMRAVEVDPERRLARAEGGAQWIDVDTATTAHGLATTGGTFVDTGIGGLTLTGGIGYLLGTNGLTCDTLVGAEVVTADGSVVRAGADGDPELLWALRGGGGNFGIVTAFEYACQPLPELHRADLAVPMAYARETLAAIARLCREMPDELNIFAVGPSVDVREGEEPSPDDPRVVGIALVFQGTAADAEATLEPLREVLALPGAHGGYAPTSYLDLQAGNGIMSFGYRNYWKGHFLRDLDETAIEAVATAMETVPASMSFILLEGINGRARNEPEGGAAFGQRKARWNVSALGIWEDPALDVEVIDWVRRSVDALAPSSLSGAGYGNYAPTDETAERVRASYGDEGYRRLAEVKARYDPDNVFRFNHNIPPAGG